MTNKTKLLKLYSELPDRIQRNRLLTRLITQIAEHHKRELQQQIVRTRWQAIQLQADIDKLKIIE